MIGLKCDGWGMASINHLATDKKTKPKHESRQVAGLNRHSGPERRMAMQSVCIHPVHAAATADIKPERRNFDTLV